MRGATRNTWTIPGRSSYFNPRSSCEERPRTGSTRRKSRKFQSTLLMRGATSAYALSVQLPRISIHAPHARSDKMYRSSIAHSRNFNPRSSCEERRQRGKDHGTFRRISIHAPHARSDKCAQAVSILELDFNPRSSCEERPESLRACWRISTFQSTLLMRGATPQLRFAGTLITFQSTLLMRGATTPSRSSGSAGQFQSTLLMRGATVRCMSHPHPVSYFNPRSSCEERRCQ